MQQTVKKILRLRFECESQQRVPCDELLILILILILI